MKPFFVVCIALAFVLSACDQQTSLPTEPEAGASNSKQEPGLNAVPVVPFSGHVFSTGPSAFCHDTDGEFTDCDPGGGIEEWSDISSLAGLGTSAGAVVYTDQSTTPPRLLLMYDLTEHTAPLAFDSFFDITFHVFEDGELEIYQVLCFGNNTFQVFEDGVDITAEAIANGVLCAVGFNGANVQAELDIPMNTVYSPDIPLFWSTFGPPPGHECPPGEPGCECPPEECEPSKLSATAQESVQTSSTIVVASSDGTTQVVGLPVGSTVPPAALCDKKAGAGLLVDLFELYRAESRNHGQFMKKVAHGSKMALESLAEFGQISHGDIGPLHGCVVSVLAKKK